MDKEQSKCFHNGIILIVNCFQYDKFNTFILHILRLSVKSIKIIVYF